MKRSRGSWEILAVVLTGIGRFLFMVWLDWKVFYIIAAILGWSIYIFSRVKNTSGLWEKWGFSNKNFASTFYTCLGFASVSMLVMAAMGYSRGFLSFSWDMIPLFLLYPIWGFIQQFLMQALVSGNLETMGWSKWAIIPFTGLLFGMVHLPFPVLSAATLLMGMAFTWIYLKWKNLWPLGLFHGWLGVILYFWVLGRNPWTEVFNMM
ncbi:CPBP family intramembrane metalloprotease [bacterium]|nr:CPBP family intramembrane metalloprotease [bacterium]